MFLFPKPLIDPLFGILHFFSNFNLQKEMLKNKSNYFRDSQG
jgi:hypothetical protein